VLRVSARTDYSSQSDYLQLDFNGDLSSGSQTTYSRIRLYGNGSAAYSSANSNQSATIAPDFGLDGSTSTATTFGNAEIYIPNYTSTTSKPLSGFGVSETNATAASMAVIAGLYRNSTAIASITLTCFGNFVTGSSFYLYGI
jgi:hypothetical protein